MKKKSHRKDVIFARIIFGMLLLIILAVIIGVIVVAVNHNRAQQVLDGIEDTVDEDEDVYEPVYIEPETEVEVPTEAAQEENTTVWSGGDVNLRSEASKTSTVLCVVPEDAEMILLSEDPVSGFYNVEYDGQQGYMAQQYVLFEDPNK